MRSIARRLPVLLVLLAVMTAPCLAEEAAAPAKPQPNDLKKQLLEAKHIGLIFNLDIQAYHVYAYPAAEFARIVATPEDQLKEHKARSTDRARLVNFYTVVATGDDFIELTSSAGEDERVLVATRFIYKVTLPVKKLGLAIAK